jgi:hypothetical protein
MIAGLPLEYACARVGACLAERPDERLWLQLRSARSVPALLEAVRESAAASAVSGVAPNADADAIELTFRQQFRTRVFEVAGWSPEAWRAPILEVRRLIDLPAIVHLAGDEPPPRWIAADPALASLALADRRARKAALHAAGWGAIVAALDEARDEALNEARGEASNEPAADSAAARPARARSGRHALLHRALAAWLAAWRSLWPPQREESRRTVDELIAALLRQQRSFPALAVESAAGARQNLAAWLHARVHRYGVQPASLFAYLALFALDLERLRAEFVVRARFAGHRGAPA